MDRSLKFFLGSTNKIKSNRDPVTGLSQESREEQTNITTIGQDPYGPEVSNETYTENVTNVKSLFNDRFFVNYLGNSSSNKYNPSAAIPEENDISLSSIIDWTQKNHPSLKLRPEDFVYLKNFRSYPANRLMVLRRYPGAIGHDLFSTNAKPLSTLVSYVKEGEMPVKINFNEKWKEVGSDLTFFNVLQDVIGIQFDSIPGVGNVMNQTGDSPLAQDLLHRLGQKLGIITSGDNIYGDPNIIYQASIRDVDGEKVSSGLESDISIEFETTYLFQEINGVDAKAAMLDIIGNILVMGTSPERFYISGAASSKLNKLIKEFSTGNIDGLFQEIKDGLSKILDDLAKQVSKILEDTSNQGQSQSGGEETNVITNIKNNLLNIASDVIKTRYQRYKWQFTGLLGTMAGWSTAPWHITIGNPKAPWFTIGNLVIDKVELIPNDVLGYSDFFTELTVKIQLKSGRSMGVIGLSNLFNNGRGRIYTNEKALKKIIVNENTTITQPNSGSTNNNTQNDTPTNTSDGSELNQQPNVSGFSLDNTDTDTNIPNI